MAGMDKKYQIFVSSTLQDLQDERRAVIEAILNMGHIPIGMELFQAGNEEQWSYIKRRIDEADYYVVIVAERYGSTKEGVSYTEMEYDYATEKGVPVAAFLLREDMRAKWRKQKDATDDRAAVERFRQKCEGKMVQYWANKDDLAAKSILSLAQIMRDWPSVGWVSAKNAVDADALNELARLSGENNKLRKQIADAEAKLRERSGDVAVEQVLLGLSEMQVAADIRVSRPKELAESPLLEGVICKVRAADFVVGRLCRKFLRGIGEHDVYSDFQDTVYSALHFLLCYHEAFGDHYRESAFSAHVGNESIDSIIDYLHINECLERQACVMENYSGQQTHYQWIFSSKGRRLANLLISFEKVEPVNID